MRVTLHITALVIALAASVAQAIWIHVPTASVAVDSDLILVAQLRSHEVVERGNRTYESGELHILKVIHGRAEKGEVLRLEWDNENGIVCPRVDHADAVNKTFVWLLKLAERSTVRADYPGRKIELARPAVQRTLQELHRHQPLVPHRAVKALTEHLSAALEDLAVDEPGA